MSARISYEGMDETIDHMERGFVPQGCDQQGRVKPTIKPKRPTCSACAGGVCITPVACEAAEDQSEGAIASDLLWGAFWILVCIAAGSLAAIVIEGIK